MDANGNVYDKPIYNRVEKNGEVYFNDGYSTACTFDPLEGMEMICWCEPWWEQTWAMAEYPEEYNKYIWFYIRNRDADTPDTLRQELALIPDTVRLTDCQRHIIDGLNMMLQWEEMDDDDESDRIESDWLKQFPLDENAQLRVNTLAELMTVESIPESCRRALWYANFKFIDYFCTY